MISPRLVVGMVRLSEVNNGRLQVTATGALRHVHEKLGPFNWALFTVTDGPDNDANVRTASQELELVDAGTLSIVELRKVRA